MPGDASDAPSADEASHLAREAWVRTCMQRGNAISTHSGGRVEPHTAC
jgi:hypothetical protein